MEEGVRSVGNLAWIQGDMVLIVSNEPEVPGKLPDTTTDYTGLKSQDYFRIFRTIYYEKWLIGLWIVRWVGRTNCQFPMI